MATWIRLPQEREDQDYWFSGSCYFTRGVLTALEPEEIIYILTDLYAFAKEKQGIDYLQIYEREDGFRVWVIDQIPRSMFPDQASEDNHFTVLLPSEY